MNPVYSLKMDIADTFLCREFNRLQFNTFIVDRNFRLLYFSMFVFLIRWTSGESCQNIPAILSGVAV